MTRLIKIITIVIILDFSFVLIRHYIRQRGRIKEKTELIGTYQQDDFVYKKNLSTIEYIHIIDTIHFVHEIYNDTLHYIDTSIYDFDFESQCIYFQDYDNVINRHGVSFVGPTSISAPVISHNIDMGELHFFKKIK